MTENRLPPGNMLAQHPRAADHAFMDNHDATGTSATTPVPTLKLRVVFGDDAMIGPGKADLLEAIGHLGSISAAGRSMKMSYKRAWMLVEEMNAAFREPLVDSTRGGPHGGGAALTQTGHEVLASYRKLHERASQAVEAEVQNLRSLLRDMSGRK